MPSALTPLYGLPHLVGASNGKDIKTVSKALAEKVEATLKNKGAPPLDSDLVTLLERVAALEEAVDGSGNTTPWKAFVPGGGWSAFGNGLRGPGIRFENGDILLRGSIKGGGAGNTNPILQLDPSQYPIDGDDTILVAANGGFGDLRIDRQGRVYVLAYSGGGNNAVVTLTGVRFTPGTTLP